MKCVTVPTTTKPGPCKPCVHPLEYLFEKAYLATTINNNRQLTPLDETLDRLLDKGMIFPNCGYCCPNCEGVYFLGSVETFVCSGETPEQIQQCIQETNGGRFANQVGIACQFAAIALQPFGAFGNQGAAAQCCSNVYASVETKVKYDEGMCLLPSPQVVATPLAFGVGLDNKETSEFVKQCCDGFDSCIDDLICWMTANSKNSSDAIDRIADKGIVEYGIIENNCTKAKVSSICKLIELLDKYYDDTPTYLNVNTSKRVEVLDRLLDRGIVISCDGQGNLVIASSETWLKYAEAHGYIQQAVVPALPEQTTTTTTVV